MSTHHRRASDRRPTGAALMAVVAAFVLGLPAVVGAEAPEVPLRRVADVKALGNERAAVGLSVRLEAVVTAFKPMLFVVQDESGAIFVDPAGLRDGVNVGQRVEITGQTGTGGFAPIVTNPTVTVLGPGRLPEPQPLSWDHLLTGRDDNAWVEVRGVVRAVTNAYEQLLLQIVGQDRQFTVWCQILPGQRAPEALLDAELRLHGVYQVVFNEAAQLIGFQLQVPGLQHLHVERPAPADPFAAPVRPIRSLLRFDPAGGPAHRARLQGVVTFHDPGKALYFRDETGGMRAEAAAGDILQPGDLVDVVGFPNAGGYPPVLEMASFRKLRSGPAPQPVRVRAEELLGGRHNNELVRLESTLLNVASRRTKPRLTLQSGETTFEADGHGANAMLGQLREGSLLDLAGVCLVDYDALRQPRSFSLRLRHPPEVTVLRHPSWWTLPRLLVLVGALGGGVALTTLWGVSLRTRVREQTAALRAQLERETLLELKYRTLAESSMVGIWQTGPAGQTVYANAAMSRLLGMDRPDEIEQVTWPEIFPPGETAPRPARHAGWATEQASTFEAEVLGKDGRRRALMVYSAPLPGPDGSRSGAIHSCVDVTERKRAEEAAVEARQSAEAASRAKSVFLATMSHEIRTPMNGILGIIELVQRTDLDSAQRNLLADCERSARALLRIFNDILDYVKIEGRDVGFEEREFCLAPLVQEVLDEAAAVAAAKPVKAGIEWMPAVPSLWQGDPARLRRVLLHLVDNAFKFTQAGSVTVRVSAGTPVNGRARLRFAVTDTGIGISDARQQLIFRPFHQADPSDSRRFGGTGLGLALCRRLVESMGGTIGVESREGRGSTFWFELDLRLGEEPNFADLRVLVAEEHPLNQRLTLLLLGKLGCQTHAVSTGDTLLASLRNEAWDVVLLARRLPNISLGDAVRTITQPGRRTPDGAARPVRIIGLIGSDSAREAEAFRAAGVGMHLTNPFTVRQLQEVLTQVCSLGKQG